MSATERKTVGSEYKPIWRERTAPIAVYGAVFVSANIFLFMIFRDARLIRAYQPGVDAASYAEIHSYILLVEIALWLIMAKAAARFIAYTHIIKRSSDGAALHYIAWAMLLSFVYAVLFDMASTFKTLFIRTPYLPFVTTTTNLLPLAVFLLLSLLLFVGSVRLKRLLPDSPAQLQRNRHIIAFGVAAFLLVVIPFAEYFYRLAPTMLDDDGLHHFTLAPGVLILTYVMPFTVIWLLGLLACLNLAQYGNRVKGRLYRPMFRKLYAGILLSYISTYLIQIFYVSNAPTNRFGIGLLSLIALIFLLIIGYGLMYRGADQLYMIEK